MLDQKVEGAVDQSLAGLMERMSALEEEQKRQGRNQDWLRRAVVAVAVKVKADLSDIDEQVMPWEEIGP